MATMSDESVAPRQATSISRWDVEADVVVVGGGCAGVCAALEARERGAEVVLVERAGGAGGASTMSGGLLYLGGCTSLQKACGFDDGPDDMRAFLMAALGPEPDEARVDIYAERSADHFEWLVDLGVPFKPSFWPDPAWTPPTDDGLMWVGENSYPFSEIARPAPRGHRPRGTGRTGGVLMGALIQALAGSGAAVHTDTRLKQLVVDDGRVVGAVVRRQGEDHTVRARGGVVLAAGGFVFNDEMLREHAPRLVQHTKIGTDYDDGLAIRAAVALGATTRHMDAAEASINFSPMLMALGIIVDANGQRFVNEDTYGGRIGQLAVMSHESRAYLIFDEEAQERVPENLRHGRHPQWVCETVEELEQETGLPEGSLRATLDVYNQHAARGADPVFHKAAKWVRPLQPPFGAMDVRSKRLDGPPDPADRATGFRVFTLGGLRTTIDGEVLHVDGNAIPGLYAAGRTTCGLPAWGYISGTSLGDGTFFGRRAGAASAAARS
jgi:3-oxo-5alpha-steroid 4-dehydrogenase